MASMARREKARRDLLLDAARKLFFTRGYEATRMEDVATAAGFSKRTVYLEFPSKGALFATLCEEAIGILQNLLVPILGHRHDDVIAQFHTIATTYLSFYAKHRGHYRVLFLQSSDAVFSDVPPAQKKRLREAEATCVGVLAHTIDRARAEGVVRKELAAWPYAVAVWGSLNGILLIEEQAFRADLAGVPVEELYWQTVDAFVRAGLAT